MNLMRLMYVGYFGGSTLKGEPPQIVIAALAERFDVVNVHVGGWLNRELRCYEPEGRLRLKVRYGWFGTGWRYEPVPARVNRPRPARKPGDVMYQPNGAWRIAA